MSLTVREVETAKPRDKAYRLTDGKGLYLQVMPNGSKHWRYNYTFEKKQKTAAYGSYPEVSLARARELHAATKDALHIGVDPTAKVAVESDFLFKAVAERWVKKNESGWTIQHTHQTRQNFTDYVYPHIGGRDIRTLTRPDLVGVMERIAKFKIHETAHRIAQRIGAVLDYAVDNGMIEAHPGTKLVRVLPERPERRGHPAVETKDLPELLWKIENYWGEPVTRIALQILAHTWLRTDSLIQTMWEGEILWDKNVWVVPGVRMKGRIGKKKDHVVPMSRQTKALFMELRDLTGHFDYAFTTNRNRGRPISNNAMLYALYSMGYKGRMTGHGFRSVASSALNESGLFNPDAIERQLAHSESDDVRAAYNRAQYLDERIKMMQWWSDYLDSQRALYTA